MTTPATAEKKVTLRCQFCLTWNRIDLARAGDRPKCGKCAKPMLLDRPVLLNDETFARTIAESDAPVFVDFYADWCGPCKMMAPHVDELARKVQGRALIAKLDTDRSPASAGSFQIRGIPTVIIFKQGKPVVQQAGAAQQVAALEALLARADA
ncbi:MAG TPA: thioredoxin [Gemmatimonadaceae bacterium]|nr:thioredoxin [Gemmatimonadaceae bacterium]